MSDLSSLPLKAPGRGRGILDAVKNRYLLRLLVDKEIQVRYRGSVLGILWSYIKPGVQFLVFYIAMGMFLGLERGMHNYAVYLFSGMIAINFFSEGFGNGARAMVVNIGLHPGGVVPELPGVGVYPGGYGDCDVAVLWPGPDFWCGERIFP